MNEAYRSSQYEDVLLRPLDMMHDIAGIKRQMRKTLMMYDDMNSVCVY